MIPDQKTSKIEIIALDYYDGATEGFVLSLGDLGTVYFKLIAWDDTQDQRLFFVTPIDKSMFEKMLDLLPGNSQPESKVWLIDGAFGNDKDELEASKIVKSCQNNLIPKSVLIQSDHIDSKPVNIFNISESLIESVEKALQDPDSLNDWLTKLKK